MTSATRKHALYNWDFNGNFWIEVEKYDHCDKWFWCIYSEQPVGDIAPFKSGQEDCSSEEEAVNTAISYLESIYCQEDKED